MWGPLSYIVVYMILKNHSLRHPIQALVCIGQIYGLILYYATSMFDLYYKDLEYCRPEPYYFWFYFFFTNFIWMVIPGCKLTQAFLVNQQQLMIVRPSLPKFLDDRPSVRCFEANVSLDAG